MYIIEGVTLLRTIDYWGIIVLFLILGAILFAIGGISSLITIRKKKMNPSLNMLLTTIEIIGVFFAFYAVFECICYQTKYQVAIDENVNVIEFVEHYEIQYKYRDNTYLVIENNPLSGKEGLENSDLQTAGMLARDIINNNNTYTNTH